MTVKIVTIHYEDSPHAFPLAAACLKAYMLQRSPDRSIELFNGFMDQDIDELAAELLRAPADIYAFPVYLWNSVKVCRLAAILKEAAECIILAGGPEITADPDRYAALPYFDSCVSGEGESVFHQLLNYIDEQKKLSPVHSGESIPLSDGDSPHLLLPELLHNDGSAFWELSRGCPFKCAFCYESKGSSRRSMVSLERAAAELTLFEEKGISQVFVLDPTFNYDKERAKQILDLIYEYAPSPYYYLELRSEFIDRELAQKTALINSSVQIGLQSCHPAVLKLLNRGFDADLFSRNIHFLNEEGVIFGFDLIYGLPGDTLEGFRHSLDFSLELLPNSLDIFPLAVLPGTDLADRAESLGMNYDKKPPYLTISNPSFSEKDMEKARSLAESTDLIYNKGKAVGWFITMADALSLSPSALIGRFDTWRQNHSINTDDLSSTLAEFLKELFADARKGFLIPLVEDLLTLHEGFSASQLKLKPLMVPENDFSNQRPVKLSDHVMLALFHYPADVLAESGMIVLSDFQAAFPDTEEHHVLFYNENGMGDMAVLDDMTALLLGLISEEPVSLNDLTHQSGFGQHYVEELCRELFDGGIIVQ